MAAVEIILTFRDLVTAWDLARAWDLASRHLDLYGSVGLLLGFASGLMPSRRWMLLVSAACATAFAVHFLHLGALTGTAMCAISVLQSLVSAGAIGPERRAAWVAPLFGLSSLAAAGMMLATWNGWPSACAGVGALFATAARLQGEPRAMRRLFLGASLCWAMHNALVGSVFGLTCDLLTLSGLGIALLRQAPGRTRAGRPAREPGPDGVPAL